MTNNNPTNSKSGTSVNTDPAPGLPAAERIFGESPVVRRPITGRHPDTTRADDAEESNLKQAASPTPTP